MRYCVTLIMLLGIVLLPYPTLAKGKNKGRPTTTADALGQPIFKKKAVGDEMQFDVEVDPVSNKIEVKQLGDKNSAAAQDMQISFFTKETEPASAPISLQTMSPPDSPPRYAGQLNNWNASYIGFVLSFHGGDQKPRKLRERFDK